MCRQYWCLVNRAKGRRGAGSIVVGRGEVIQSADVIVKRGLQNSKAWVILITGKSMCDQDKGTDARDSDNRTSSYVVI